MQQKKKIKIFNSPNAFSRSVSQLAWGMIINLTRDMYSIHNDIINGRWPKKPGNLLEKKNLGIIGLGCVGQEFIKNGKGFKMNILGNDIKKVDKKIIKKLGIKIVKKENLLKKSDIVVLCVNLNKTSYHLINSREFSLMKKTAILINVSRGSVVSEKALINALKSKKIKGAGIDVFENEPPKRKNPLFKQKNCIFSSHNAFNTHEEVSNVHKNTIFNLIKGLS